jgi:hypothetical protein
MLEIATITPGHDQWQNRDKNKIVNTSARWWRGGSMTGLWNEVAIIKSKVEFNV